MRKKDGLVSVLIDNLFGKQDLDNEEVEDEGIDSIGTIYLKSEETNQIFTLHSARGSSTDTNFYFPRYAFLEERGRGVQIKGWYSIQNDGSKCIITILNDSEHPMPSNAEIYIKTQPDCNEGKGIIMQVKKSK